MDTFHKKSIEKKLRSPRNIGTMPTITGTKNQSSRWLSVHSLGEEEEEEEEEVKKKKKELCLTSYRSGRGRLSCTPKHLFGSEAGRMEYAFSSSSFFFGPHSSCAEQKVGRSLPGIWRRRREREREENKNII